MTKRLELYALYLEKPLSSNDIEIALDISLKKVSKRRYTPKLTKV